METVTLNKKDLESILLDAAAKQRQDIRRQICSLKEAREILGLGENAFYQLLNMPECLIQPSALKGKYVLKSIYDEAKRLNNGYELL